MTPETILSSCRFFTAVEGESRQRLIAMAELCSFTAGERVFTAGDPCPGVFIVGKGLVRVYRLAPSGKEHVLHLVAPGNTFAEVAAIGGFDCPASAEAVEPTMCLLLPNDPFRAALSEDHPLCLQLLVSFSGWVRHLVGLLEDITLRDAAGRVARYLLDCADSPNGSVHLLGLKKHLASHLNLTSETLSRTLRRLSNAGLISEDESGDLVVREPERLGQVAQGMFPQV